MRRFETDFGMTTWRNRAKRNVHRSESLTKITFTERLISMNSIRYPKGYIPASFEGIYSLIESSRVNN